MSERLSPPLSARFIQSNIAGGDEVAMNAKQIPALFIEVRGR
jgi:hypothetical protein